MSALLLAPIIAIAVLLAVAGLLAAQQGRQKHLMGKVVDQEARPRQVPSILFFTGASCNICHTAQKPALQTLAEWIDSVDIREIDVAERADLARMYRVMTLPTTILLNPDRQVIGINVGFASAETLRDQLLHAGLHAAA